MRRRKILLRPEETGLITVFNTRGRKFGRELVHGVSSEMIRLARVVTILVLAANSVAGRSANPDEIVAGDNLIFDGIPEIPVLLAQADNRYNNLRYASLLSWHPLKPEMLISTQFGDTPQIHQVKFPGGARTQLTFLSDAVCQSSYEPKKGEYFIFGKDTNGDEFYQLHRFDPATGDITSLMEGKSRNESPLWSHSGEWLWLWSTRRKCKDSDLYVITGWTQNSLSSPKTAGDTGAAWWVLV